jgi:hypothetical protein
MKIIDRLPLLPASQLIRFGRRNVRFHRDSMVVWLSVSLPLGFPALRENDLDFWFDSKTGQFSVRTADWRSRLIRLLYRLF